MSWLKLDLRPRDAFPHETVEARIQRQALRKRLLGEADLTGAAALEIARQLGALESSPRDNSLQGLP